MKKLILLFLFPILINAQFNYRAISNIVVSNPKKGAVDVGINYEFRNKQVQLLYNLTEAYFVFGTYNFNTSTNNYKTYSMWGGDVERTSENDNSGFSFGAGKQHLGKIGPFNNTEVLVGLEIQKVNSFDYATNYTTTYKEHIINNYFKAFGQFNMTKSRKFFDLGFSMKLSYLKYTLYEYNKSVNDFTGKSTLLIDPTMHFNFKMLDNKNLLFTSQIGLSTALWPISDFKSNGYSSSESIIFLISPILKFGLQYRILTK